MFRMATMAAVLAMVPAVAFAGENEDAAKLYDLVIQATPRVAKGGAGTVTVTITPKNGAELHKEAPIKVALKSGAPVALSKSALGRADMKMTGPAGAFEVPFTASAAGKGAIEGDVSFYICTDKLCVRQQRQVSATVEVN